MIVNYCSLCNSLIVLQLFDSINFSIMIIVIRLRQWHDDDLLLLLLFLQQTMDSAKKENKMFRDTSNSAKRVCFLKTILLETFKLHLKKG
jgi:hypothetical protein